jgi:IstB-like ATP binding protein
MAAGGNEREWHRRPPRAAPANACGSAAVRAGRKVRYFTAADLADTLYRGLADNSVGKVIEALLRNDLILVDEVGFAACQPVPGLLPPMILLEVNSASFRERQQERLTGESMSSQYVSDGGAF